MKSRSKKERRKNQEQQQHEEEEGNDWPLNEGESKSKEA